MLIVGTSAEALGKAPQFKRQTRSGFANSWLAVAVVATVFLGEVSLVARQAAAVDFVNVAQTAALDQPRINVMFRNEAGQNLVAQRPDPNDIFGPPITTVNVTAYFDTGASGILISENTAMQLGVQKELNAVNEPVKFFDVGVLGEDEFHVSKPLYLGVAPYHPFVNADLPASYTQRPAPIRAQIGPATIEDDQVVDPIEALLRLLTTPDFNVVGMPAMAGKVVVIDARHTNSTANFLLNAGDIGDLEIEELANLLNQLELRTNVYDPAPKTPLPIALNNTNPGIPDTTHHVKLSYGSFDRFTRTDPVAGPGPSLVHNPFIGPNPVLQLENNPSIDNTPKVKIGFKPTPDELITTEGSFLLDTGAVASMISLDLASELKIRYVENTHLEDNAALEMEVAPGVFEAVPNQFTLKVGGIGAPEGITIAGFILESLLVRTMEGNPLHDNDPRHLNFAGAPVLVHDIELLDPNTNQPLTLDGIFGMNFLVASLNIAGFDPTTGLPQAFGYTAGAFDWLAFDEPNGTLGLALNSSFHMKGDFNLDGKITNADIQEMLNALNDLDTYKTLRSLDPEGLLTVADVNSDGFVNNSDIAPFLRFLAGEPLPPGMQLVPEPASALLALFGAAAVLLVRRRQKTN